VTSDRGSSVGRETTLYATPWDALYAGIAAAGASLYGTARPHTDSLGGRTGCGAWTDRDKAEQIADGLRLTGYEVVLLPGYSTGVVILDPQEVRHA
jgi:expansin (peptidoglycan-binding protein)